MSALTLSLLSTTRCPDDCGNEGCVIGLWSGPGRGTNHSIPSWVHGIYLFCWNSYFWTLVPLSHLSAGCREQENSECTLMSIIGSVVGKIWLVGKGWATFSFEDLLKMTLSAWTFFSRLPIVANDQAMTEFLIFLFRLKSWKGLGHGEIRTSIFFYRNHTTVMFMKLFELIDCFLSLARIEAAIFLQSSWIAFCLHLSVFLM